MRERPLLLTILLPNLALVAALIVYVVITRSERAATPAVSLVHSTPLDQQNDREAAKASGAAGREEGEGSTRGVVKKFDWRDATSERYPEYLDRLREAGCPERTVRTVVLSDVEEMFARKRMELAEGLDQKWWREEPSMASLESLRQIGAAQEQERLTLLTRLLGPEIPLGEGNQAVRWSLVQLTGAVLGGLSRQAHNEVEEICERAIDRYQTYFWARYTDGEPPCQVRLASLREEVRRELSEVLSAEQMGEFLLRYSSNASRLRSELFGFSPTPEEFRRIFTIIDPIDHRLQRDYGSPESLSLTQRERWRRQREMFIKEVLTPERYASYLQASR